MRSVKISRGSVPPYGARWSQQAPAFLPLVLMGLACVWHSRAASSGSISGIVRTAEGNPIRGSVTVHDLSTPRVSGNVPFDRRFASRTDGTFQIDGVPAGRYELCIDAPQEAVLDPCLWSAPAPEIAVKEGEAASGINVAVQTGAVFRVRVNDPAGLVGARPLTAMGRALSMGVITGEKHLVPLRPLSVNSGGQEHFVVIPLEEPLAFSVSSANYRLTDENNVALPRGGGLIPIRVGRGESPRPLIVNVLEK